jgi:predicted DNA-binding transcriptional regulator YafY
MKTDRLLALTIYLINHGTVSASALSERFEVSKRTIQRDIDSLNMAGIPVSSTLGAEGGYRIEDGYKLQNQIAGADDYRHIVAALRGLASAYDDRRIHSGVIVTKAIPEAAERIAALTENGYRKAELVRREHYYEKHCEPGV